MAVFRIPPADQGKAGTFKIQMTWADVGFVVAHAPSVFNWAAAFHGAHVDEPERCAVGAEAMRGQHDSTSGRQR